MKRQRPEVDHAYSLPDLRFEISEAARILRMSRAQLYMRIQQGSLNPQKDGARTYVTRRELERYVNACARRTSANSIGQGRTVWPGREGSEIAAADATEVVIASA
jgi:hypothetical protein